LTSPFNVGRLGLSGADLDVLPSDYEGQSSGVSKERHHRLGDHDLVSSAFVEAHSDGKLLGIFRPLRHTIIGIVSPYITTLDITVDKAPLYIYGDMPWVMTAMWQDARTPALAIVARGDQIETISPVEYVVRSQSKLDTKYRVTVTRDRWECECAFFSETKIACVHIYAVRFREGFKSEATAPQPSRVTCIRCQSGSVVLSGKRHNKSGTLARYLCKACDYRFVGRDGFQHRRSDPEKIALALDLYFRGMSVRKVAEHFAQVHNLKISHVTVYNWVAHFGKLAAEWMDRQGARTGERWHIDETVVSVNGTPEYIWNILDADTRFLMATHVSHGRSLAETRVPIKKAKAVTPDRPMEVFSDGMNSYRYAIGRELAYRSGSKVVNPHHRVPSIRAPESNNLVERLQGTEKERIKVMRGFDNERGTSALIEGFRAHYNLVRDHQTLHTTPGVAAGFAPLTGFRWAELLKRAAPSPKVGYPEIEVIPN
jgi:putative transposase